MVGLARAGIPIRTARFGIEGTALTCGWALGGIAGAGTVAYAVAIGPLLQVLMRRQRAAGVRVSHLCAGDAATAERLAMEHDGRWEDGATGKVGRRRHH